MEIKKFFPYIRKYFENLPIAILILILILSIMSPLGSNIPVESAADDLLNHISGIIESKNALIEGQFPIRVAPNALDNERYPIFQFYGNFPYTLGGIIYILTDNPYFAYKIVIMLILFIGAYYLYKFGLSITTNKYAAIIGSTVYLTAPYLLVDIHGRFAFPEIVSFGLIPCILFYVFKSYQSKNITDFLLLTFFLTLLYLTHNIFSLYTTTFIFLVILGLYFIYEKSFLSILSTISSLIFAFLMSAWYLLPQLILLNDITMKNLQNNPFDLNYLTNLYIVFAPSKILPLPINYFKELGSTNLGLQIGYPLLIFIGCGLIVLISKNYTYSRKLSEKIKINADNILKILVLCSIISLIIIVAPINFWEFLPNQFKYVQFSYRIFVYLVIFGAMLTPIVLIKIFQDFKLEHAIILLLICVSFTSTYLPNHIGESTDAIANEILNPDIGRGGATLAYQMSINSLSKSNYPYGNKIDIINGYSGKWLLNNASLCINGSQYSDSIILQISGRVPEETDNLTLIFLVNGESINQTKLYKGSFTINVPINDIKKYNNTQLFLEINSDKYFNPNQIDQNSTDYRKLTLLLDSFIIIPQNNISYKSIQKDDPQIQRLSSKSLLVNNNETAIVELPVLYYPNLIEIKNNGKSIPYINIGKNVGIIISPGNNEITFDFTGLNWANYISKISLLIFIVICFYQIIRNIRGKK